MAGVGVGAVERFGWSAVHVAVCQMTAIQPGNESVVPVHAQHQALVARQGVGKVELPANVKRRITGSSCRKAGSGSCWFPARLRPQNQIRRCPCAHVAFREASAMLVQLACGALVPGWKSQTSPWFTNGVVAA